MLASKLLGAVARPPIQYVGGYSLGYAGTASDIVVSLTSLTGGIASSPIAGDLVVVFFGWSQDYAQSAKTISGFANLTYMFGNDTEYAHLQVNYKKLTASDTSFTITGGTGSQAYGGAVNVHVFRGGTVVDTFTTAKGQNSAIADPPSITLSVQNTFVITGACGALGSNKTASYSSSELSNFVSGNGIDNVSCVVGSGYKSVTGGSFDPSPFSLSISDAAVMSWAACTLSLKQA